MKHLYLLAHLSQRVRISRRTYLKLKVGLNFGSRTRRVRIEPLQISFGLMALHFETILISAAVTLTLSHQLFLTTVRGLRSKMQTCPTARNLPSPQATQRFGFQLTLSIFGRDFLSIKSLGYLGCDFVVRI
mgnify:CR=1 FL=1